MVGIEKLARQNLEFLGGLAVPRPRSRRELTDKFLSKMVLRHRDLAKLGTGATPKLAKEEQVAVSTVKHWLKTADERGLKESS